MNQTKIKQTKLTASKPSSTTYESLQKLQMSLPLLPGTDFNLHKQMLKNHRKSHAFDYCNAVSVFKPETPGIGGTTLTGQDDMKIHTSIEIYPNNDGTGEKVPSYVAFDRKVLRFYGYFQEAVNERREETYRIRRVNIYFYLEDDTIHVSEPRSTNSGIPQGTLIRRHRIPKPANENGQHFIVSDLNVGQEITFYSKTFKITGCDKFTREFLTDLHIPVQPNSSSPSDPFEVQRQELTSRMKPVRPKLNPQTQNLKQFLENDRRVLRFYCIWDDTNSCFGDIRHMILHYFLSDNTIEIRESIPTNSGRDGNNTLFLRRCKLPKRSTKSTTFSEPDTSNPADFYTDADLCIGSVLHLYGRPFVICDVDAFTREYYIEKYGVSEFNPVAFNEIDQDIENDKKDHETLFPFFANLYRDTSDDVSPSSLIPNITTHNQPQPDAKSGKTRQFDTMMKYDGVLVRFAANLVNDNKIDQTRKFIVTYHPADGTISAFEPRQRNTGIVGGKFMEKGRPLKSGVECYKSEDFYIGAELLLHGHRFVITGADEFAFKFMAKHPEMFPMQK